MDLPEESPEGAPPARPDPGRLRASDADRDHVADQLREALAEGRLSPEEHAERIDAVYAAKTYAELAPIVEDLPTAGRPGGRPGGRPEQRQPAMDVAGGGAATSLPAPVRHAANIVAIFGGAGRKGRWLVEPHTTILAVFGGVELDLRQAVLSQREVTINVTCVFGGVEVKVPPGVRVTNSAAAVFGGVQLPDDDPLEPDAPVIKLTGLALFGGVDVKRRPADSGGPGGPGALAGDDLRARQREIQREYHERRRDAHRELRQRHRELRDLRRAERQHRRRDG